MSEPLLEETRKAEVEEKMKHLSIELNHIANKLGAAINNFTYDDPTKIKDIMDALDMFKKLNTEYNFKNYWSVLKTFTSSQLDEVKTGVSKMFNDNGGSIIVNDNNKTVTIKTPIGEKILNEKNLVLEETCNPMHNKPGGSRRRKQYGGVFDPISILAIGLTGTAATAVGITMMIALSFIYLGICILLYTGTMRGIPIEGLYWLVFGVPCLPVGLLLFLNSVRNKIKNSCSSNGGGKLRTMRKRFLIKKNIKVNKKTKSKKTKK